MSDVGFWRRFWLAWRLAKHGELLSTQTYPRRCSVPMPGSFDARLTLEPGDTLSVYLLRLK